MTALYDVSTLRVLSLPICQDVNSFNYIGYGAGNTFSLSIYLLSTSVVKISYAYENKVSKITIYVPNALLNAYKTARYWSTFSSRFVGV